MTVSKTTWVGALALLVVTVGLPVAAHWARRQSRPGCALDGGKIDPLYRAAVVDGEGAAREFCCLRCAEIWLGHQTAPAQAVLVTDEASGEAIAAAAAFYVRSFVVTTPATGNRTHAFRSRTDAENHAARFAGTVLSESEKPFR
jgi:endogenous inhibitor of DNA gyrase (YacG/DUF329 family)